MQHGVIPVARVKVRPAGGGEVQLSVRAVPQQKVRQALFSACANEQVWLTDQRSAGLSEKPIRELSFRNLLT